MLYLNLWGAASLDVKGERDARVKRAVLPGDKFTLIE
jgi:hypothetical protein